MVVFVAIDAVLQIPGKSLRRSLPLEMGELYSDIPKEMKYMGHCIWIAVGSRCTDNQSYEEQE